MLILSFCFQLRHFGIRPVRGHGTFLLDGCLPHPLRPLNSVRPDSRRQIHVRKQPLIYYNPLRTECFDWLNSTVVKSPVQVHSWPINSTIKVYFVVFMHLLAGWIANLKTAIYMRSFRLRNCSHDGVIGLKLCIALIAEFASCQAKLSRKQMWKLKVAKNVADCAFESLLK